MELDENFFRRMNDEEYQIALSEYLDKICEEESKDIEEQCKKNPFLKNRIEKTKEKIENLSNEEFAEFMSFAIGEKSKRVADKVNEFNKKWDKEHYKVIYGEFGK